MNTKVAKYLVLFLAISNTINCIYAQNPNSNSQDQANPKDLPQSSQLYTVDISAWIIVAGDDEDGHPTYYSIEQGCNAAYDTLLDLGYSDDDIYYLAADWDGSLPPNADDVASRINIEYAIINWASERVNENRGLGIYLFSHGSYNKMSLPDGAYLHDTQLDSYLGTLEWISDMERSVVIYEGCFSGSFIDPLSKDGRIIITSTDIENLAYLNYDLDHAMFSEHFWAAMWFGQSIGSSFNYGTDGVKLYDQTHSQNPLIDDNYDEVGHPVNDYFGDLPNGGDGWDALAVTIGPPSSNLGFVQLVACELRSYYPYDVAEIPLWVIVENSTEIEYIRVRILPEWLKYPEPHETNEGISYFIDSDFYQYESFTLKLKSDWVEGNTKNYTSRVNIQKNPNLFGKGNGTYTIIYEAKMINGPVAQPITTSVVLNENGQKPLDLIPPTISITKPTSNLEIKDNLTIAVEGKDNYALDSIQIFLDGELLDEISMPSYLPYPSAVHNLDSTKYTNGIHNITAVAIDTAGNQEYTSVFVNFQNGSILNFDYLPYLIGAAIGIGVSLVGSLIIRGKKKK